jgi:hypothetical protein
VIVRSFRIDRSTNDQTLESIVPLIIRSLLTDRLNLSLNVPFLFINRLNESLSPLIVPSLERSKESLYQKNLYINQSPSLSID